MAEDEQSQRVTMTQEETEKWHTDMRKELADLEFAQAMFYSKYKQDRIIRLRGRLGITVD